MNLKHLLKRVLLLISVFAAFLAPAAPVAAAGVLDQACQVPDSTLCQESRASANRNTIYGPDGIVTKAVKLLSFVIGFAAVVMIIIGGFKYVLSAGDPNSVNSAKNTILYAIIGLVIAALAQAIIIFVVNKL